MDIEEYFLNANWICINDIQKNDLLSTLNLKTNKSIKWEEGYELITNHFDEKIFLNFKINQWDQ